jgi:hypothetical protein
MIKSLTVIASTLALSSCADMKATRAPENKIELNINQSYQSAYRRTLESIMKECNFDLDSIKNASFDDNNTANITMAQHGVVGWTLDFIKKTENTSIINFYTYYQAQNKYAFSIQNGLNKGFKGCIFD